MTTSLNERFSGHESFVCRYGWLPKVYAAVKQTPLLLKDEELAMNVLGIGRNMVKSVQFWAEAAAVIESASSSGHVPGKVGERLFGVDGWDPYLESLESLWLIHWQLSTAAQLAAWNEVFGEGKLVRFDRPRLISALAQRGVNLARPLAPSTLEQHASIFVQTYFQAERGTDDTSWCPLQDLNLIGVAKTEDGRLLYNSSAGAPVGLTLRLFGMVLADFIRRQGHGGNSADFVTVLKGEFSPGVVFRLDEHQLRQLLANAIAGPFKKALKFVDTADTQSVILDLDAVAPEYRLWAQEGELQHA